MADDRDRESMRRVLAQLETIRMQEDAIEEVAVLLREHRQKGEGGR